MIALPPVLGRPSSGGGEAGTRPCEFPAAGITALVNELSRRRYRVIAPVARDSALVLDELRDARELPWGVGVATLPGPQRVLRVQGTWRGLCHCRARHAFPGPGHARRLRSAVPCLPPRLLRLLRLDPPGAHRRDGRAAAGRRRGSGLAPARAERGEPRRPGLSRDRGRDRVRSRPARRWRGRPV